MPGARIIITREGGASVELAETAIERCVTETPEDGTRVPKREEALSREGKPDTTPGQAKREPATTEESVGKTDDTDDIERTVGTVGRAAKKARQAKNRAEARKEATKRKSSGYLGW